MAIPAGYGRRLGDRIGQAGQLGFGERRWRRPDRRPASCWCWCWCWCWRCPVPEPGRPLDQERTAVILGNAMGGGEKHYQTARRIAFPETARELAGAQRPAGTSVIEDCPAIRLAQKPGHLSPEHSEAYMVGGPLPGSPRPVGTYASTGSGHDHTMATGDTASDPSPRPWPTKARRDPSRSERDGKILARPRQPGTSIIKEHSRAPSPDAQEVRPSTTVDKGALPLIMAWCPHKRAVNRCRHAAALSLRERPDICPIHRGPEQRWKTCGQASWPGPPAYWLEQ